MFLLLHLASYNTIEKNKQSVSIADEPLFYAVTALQRFVKWSLLQSQKLPNYTGPFIITLRTRKINGKIPFCASTALLTNFCY